MSGIAARRIPFRQERYLGLIRRRIVQGASLIALHSSFVFDLKWICNPILSCHGCPLSWFACPVGILVHYAGYRVFPLMAAGWLLVVGAALGRFLCGWVCPAGLVQDLLYKIPTRKIELPRWTRAGKYATLAILVGLLPFLLGESTLFSFCRFCPSSALQVTIPALLREGAGGISLTTFVKLVVLGATVVFAVFNSRFFCRVLCPIAALMAPFNHVSFLRVGREKECSRCLRCNAACPVQIAPFERITKGLSANRHTECIGCRDCVSICSKERRSYSR